MRSIRKPLGLVLPYILFLAFGLTFFSSTGRDDSHITYWAAHALSNYGEIVNYTGDRVEQSTSLLHTLILAAAHLVSGADIVDIGTVLSVFLGIFSIYLTGRVAARVNVGIIDEARLLTATFLSLVYWSFGGLEATLVCAIALSITLLMTDFLARRTLPTAISLLLLLLAYLLVRPEAYFIAALYLGLLLLAAKRIAVPTRPILFLLGFVTVVFASIVLWRLYYFGAVFPQPVAAKMGAPWLGKVAGGLDYLVASTIDHPVLLASGAALLVGLLDLARGRSSSPAFALVLLFVLAQLSAVVAVGGDWMEGGRFFVPFAPLLIIVLLQILKKRDAFYNLGLPLLFAANILSLFVFAHRASPSIPIFYYERYASRIENRDDYSVFELSNRLHIRDAKFIEAIDAVVRDLLPHRERVTIVSIQAGMVFYHLAKRHFRKLTFADLPSLVSRNFSDCSETRSFAGGRVGIELDYHVIRRDKGSILTECLGELPDVIFDLDYESFPRVDDIEALGYELVYAQTGKIQFHDLFPGALVGAEQFVMVRKELAERAGLRFRSEAF